MIQNIISHASGMLKKEFKRCGHLILEKVFSASDIFEMQNRLDSIIAGSHSKHGRVFIKNLGGDYQTYAIRHNLPDQPKLQKNC